MKHLLIFLLYMGMTFGAFSQFTWTDPVPVSDSVTDNRNASMPSGLFEYDDSVFIVYEKVLDSATTALWCRNLSQMGTPFLLKYQYGARFEHPLVGQGQMGDTLLYVFYQTNINGNWDIYYIKYLRDGAVSDPVPVRTTPADETCYSYVKSLGAVWEEDGKIVFQDFQLPGGYPGTNDTVVIEQGSCHAPVLSYGYCAWLKVTGTDTVIHYSTYNFFTCSWSAPMGLTNTGDQKNLAFNLDYGSTQLLWQSMADSVWQIEGKDMSGSFFLDIPGFPGFNNIQPSFVNIMIAVEGHLWPDYPCYYSFASDSSGNYEIYLNKDQPFGGNYLYNISGWPGKDVHPQFFISMSYSFFGITYFLTWESERNGHSQIWMTSVDIPVGIDEKDRDTGFSSAYPNPFSSMTTIDYTLDRPGRTTAEIFSISGLPVRKLADCEESPGKHSLSWDGKNDRGTSMPPGIYFCRLQVNGVDHRQKLVLY
jgi:hypothetical protein